LESDILSSTEILSGTLSIIIILFLFVLFILWFLLPFAVFGIKDRLDQLINQNEQIISLLSSSTIESTLNKGNATVTKIEPTLQQSPKVYKTGKKEPEL